MKILHTSDWHLGMPLQLGTMAGDQRFFFEQLYSIIEENGVDAVICAGDIFDTGTAGAEAMELYSEAATNICAGLKKKMIVIAGNHDSGARLSSCRELLKSSGLYVYGRITRDIIPVSTGNADIYPIPFFNRCEAAALFPEKKDLIKSQQDALQVICDNIRASMDRSRVNIVVSHSYIVNAQLSESDRSAKVGSASAVSKEVFDGFDYTALGHIHKPQVISDTIRYSGSPLKYSFGAEESQTKQVIIFDTDTLEQKEAELKMRHDRKSISGTYSQICEMTGYENDYLKITVTDRTADLPLLSELKEHFPYLLELYGRSFESSGRESSVSADEIEKMDETSIMLRFLKEQYDFEPSGEQIRLFDEAVKKSREENDAL